MRPQQMATTIELQMALQKQEFSRILKQARRDLGLSQEKVANEIGVTAKTYGEWERVPGSWPRFGQYDKLADVLRVDRETLLGPMENAGQVGGSARLDEIARMTAENNAMLRALLAHAGVSVESLADAPADLIGALRNGQSQGAKSRSRV